MAIITSESATILRESLALVDERSKLYEELLDTEGPGADPKKFAAQFTDWSEGDRAFLAQSCGLIRAARLQLSRNEEKTD